MENDDLAILLKDAPAEEVDMIHRLMHEWGVGPEGSFPVQLALLTRVQWRMAASVPRSLDDSRKWLEQHLVEYRRQTTAQVVDFADLIDAKGHNLKRGMEIILEAQAKATQETMTAMRRQSAAAEHAANALQQQVKTSVFEWKQAASKLSQERQDLQSFCVEWCGKLEWWTLRFVPVMAVIFVLVGILIGHFIWR